MDVTLSNTLSGKKEVFKPIKSGHVGMYNCGPTVYNYAHLGNLRSYVFADILRRTLEYNGYDVTQVINITDIGHLTDDGDLGDDKMTRGLKREGLDYTLENMKKLGEKYTEEFLKDLKELNIESPTHLPKASEHISEDIELIKKLEEKGFVYEAENGMYFDTSKFPGYPKLGNIKVNTDPEFARVAEASGKKNPIDFAVWKFNDSLGYESHWGKGFPGWHIECSAMSKKYLGETFDIHTGGIDHIPVHHNNEIAQSESANGVEYVHYWLHNAFLNTGNEKMAKSADNFLRIGTLVEKNINPLAYRYFLLGAHYKTQMEFSWEALEAAENAYKRLSVFVSELPDGGKISESYHDQFQEKINNDLDTAGALAVVWDLLKDSSISSADKRATIIDFDKVLGLNLSKKRGVVPLEIIALVQKREEARKNKDFAASDALRKELEDKGFTVKDTEQGPVIAPL
jgi:cysteinyl-tRNA synthetase